MKTPKLGRIKDKTDSLKNLIKTLLFTLLYIEFFKQNKNEWHKQLPPKLSLATLTVCRHYQFVTVKTHNWHKHKINSDKNNF